MTEMPDVQSIILKHEDGVIAVNKPAGISSTGLSLEDPDCLQHRLMSHFDTMIWAVHQLDKDTSGVNIFVATKSLVDHQRKRMRYPEGSKVYLALCHGDPSFDQTIVEEPIGFLDRENTRLGVTADGKSAATLVDVLGRNGRYALLRLKLKTGRTHQIRIHLQHVGHPLVGEYWYRETPCKLASRQMLHAHVVRLGGEHPITIKAPIPADFVATANSLGLDLPKDIS